jgi:hypothetical protein
MLRRFVIAAAAVSAAAVGIPQAHAFPPAGVPTTVNPGLLTGLGIDSEAIFSFADAADTSNMNMTIPPFGFVFANHANGGHLANHPGDTVDLGALSGGVQFGLDNLTTGESYLSNVADVNGNFHVFYTTNFDDFGVGPLPLAAANAIAATGANTVTFVGWEDHTLVDRSDFDYNGLAPVSWSVERLGSGYLM